MDKKKQLFTFFILSNKTNDIATFKFSLTTVVAISIIILLGVSIFCYLLVSYSESQSKIDYAARVHSVNIALEEEVDLLTAEINSMRIEIEEMEDLIYYILEKTNVDTTLYQDSEDVIVNRCEEEISHPIVNRGLDDLIEVQVSAGRLNSIINIIMIHIAKVDSKPLIWPAIGRISSGFGIRQTPYSKNLYQFHTGVDIIGSYRSYIRATADGVVSFVGYRGTYGNLIIIDHSGSYQTYYAHLQGFNVHKGDEVTRGQIIGFMGSSGRTTGTHLHYEVRRAGRPINPYFYMTYKHYGDERISTHY